MYFSLALSGLYGSAAAEPFAAAERLRARYTACTASPRRSRTSRSRATRDISGPPGALQGPSGGPPGAPPGEGWRDLLAREQARLRACAKVD